MLLLIVRRSFQEVGIWVLRTKKEPRRQLAPAATLPVQHPQAPLQHRPLRARQRMRRIRGASLAEGDCGPAQLQERRQDERRREA